MFMKLIQLLEIKGKYKSRILFQIPKEKSLLMMVMSVNIVINKVKVVPFVVERRKCVNQVTYLEIHLMEHLKNLMKLKLKKKDVKTELVKDLILKQRKSQ